MLSAPSTAAQMYSALLSMCRRSGDSAASMRAAETQISLNCLMSVFCDAEQSRGALDLNDAHFAELVQRQFDDREDADVCRMLAWHASNGGADSKSARKSMRRAISNCAVR